MRRRKTVDARGKFPGEPGVSAMAPGNTTRAMKRRRQGNLAISAALSLLGLLFLLCGYGFAGTTASISGTVRDTTGATIPGATITARNTGTGISQSLESNAQGFYSFQALALGLYNVEIQKAGFQTFRQTGLVLDVNSALVVDAALNVGDVKEAVTVSSAALHVETASTQLGEVIADKEMTGVPLVSRSYTDLLALQPGVVSSSSGMTGGGAGGASGSFISAGFAMPGVSGSLNAGNLSVNGMREANNGFLLNGATVQEFGFGGTSVIPDLDSIAEFRILTNNFDAEYGNYSGGQINVITKSGTNQFHGDLFEFLRNTDFDAANYFDQGKRGAYHQNQFGGTIGGPIKHDGIFFFADYQGNRLVQGVSTGLISVPSPAEQGGDFSGLAGQMTGTVAGPAWASQLSSKLGYAVTPGEAYNTPTCANTSQCVFPNARIPNGALSPIAKNLLKYVPSPNGNGGFSTSAFSQRLRDDKTSGRLDANSRFGMLTAYYFFDDYTLNSPYPSGQATQPVPGFNTLGTGRTQVINLGDSKTFGTAVNDFRFEFVRAHDNLNKPSGGAGVTLNSLGFTTGASTLGINPLSTAVEGVPEIDFNNFSIGVPSRVLGLVENTFQVSDSFSKVIATHTLAFGGSYHHTQLAEQLSNVENGNFQFFGTETGIDFADFLLGAPTSYVQGQAPFSNGRSNYFGLFGQDSWRMRTNVTLNYGLRWEASTPWYEQHNELETLIPGEQSRVFPGAPAGWVFPGDPNVPKTLAPTRYNNFAPRIGINYAPNAKSGWLSKLTGGPGQTSIRAGYGLFYSSFEGATDFNEIGDPPYGFFYVSPAPPSFATPFADRGTGNSEQQRFPVQFPPTNVSAKNPDNSVNWSLFEPISSSPGFYYKNRLPYAEDYELSIQRDFPKVALLTISYVGTQAHRLLSTMEANPGNPALCLSLSQASQVQAGTQTCGPGLENNVFSPIGGGTVNGTRGPFPSTFGSNGYFITNGTSSYNSLQVNVRHASGPLNILAGYTYSKSLDESSGYGEQVNPFNPKLSRGLSAFDVTHNFVFSYNYKLPFDRLGGPKRLTSGWQLSGITRFSTGLPVTLYETDDQSLLGTAFAGPIPLGLDTPNFQGGPLHFGNPRSGPYFNPALFTQETLGHLGTARRRFFHGPGVSNWDMALLKDTHVTERLNLQFRAEFFNVFNHTQFAGVNGNFNAGGGFGQVTGARDPRIGQLALKLLF